MRVVFVRLIGQQNQLLFISLKMKFGNQFVCMLVYCVSAHTAAAQCRALSLSVRS